MLTYTTAPSNPTQHTLINLEYRDQSNYRFSASIRVSGILTEQNLRKIESTLQDGEFIDVANTRLPAVERLMNFTPGEDDHTWITISSIHPIAPLEKDDAAARYTPTEFMDALNIRH